MLKRFVVAFVAFIALIVPGALLLAMLASPASPAPLERPGCEQTIANAAAQVAAMQARVKSAGGAQGPAICNAARLYFLELVKARVVTALCKEGADRDRDLDLDRLDADVEHVNETIAARCG